MPAGRPRKTLAPLLRARRAREQLDNITSHMVPGVLEGELWYMDMATGRGITGEGLELIRTLLTREISDLTIAGGGV